MQYNGQEVRHQPHCLPPKLSNNSNTVLASINSPQDSATLTQRVLANHLTRLGLLWDPMAVLNIATHAL